MMMMWSACADAALLLQSRRPCRLPMLLLLNFALVLFLFGNSCCSSASWGDNDSRSSGSTSTRTMSRRTSECAFVSANKAGRLWHSGSSSKCNNNHNSNSRQSLSQLLPVTLPSARRSARVVVFSTAPQQQQQQPSPPDSSGNASNGNSNSNSNNDTTVVTVMVMIESPVLQQVYPALLRHVAEYGHSNIPLGSPEGRQCATLRRLHAQQKLSAADVALLEEDNMNFTWHSLEDVYRQQKDRFGEFVQRLQQYAADHDGDVSPPKKYAADPELGAWVTAVRRLHAVQQVDAEHVAALNQITTTTTGIDGTTSSSFAWTSPRVCGSQFMQQYRQILERLSLQTTTTKDDCTKRAAVLSDPTVAAWIRAQQAAQLSDTRKHYMAQLVGSDDWMEWRPTTTTTAE